MKALLIAAYRDTAYNPIKCVETSGCNSGLKESQSSTQEWLDNNLKRVLSFSIDIAKHFWRIKNQAKLAQDDKLLLEKMWYVNTARALSFNWKQYAQPGFSWENFLMIIF